MAESSCQTAVKQILLLDLSPDILIKILTFCTVRTISNLSVCCKQLYALCNTDILWKYITSYRYDVTSRPAILSDLSYKCLFQNLYYFLYQLRGVWVLHLAPYNMVLSVSQSPDNPLEFIGKIPELRNVHNMNNPFKYHDVAVFSLVTSRTNNLNGLQFSCLGKFEGGKRDPLTQLRLAMSSPKNLVCRIRRPDSPLHDVYSSERFNILASLCLEMTCELRLSKVVFHKEVTIEPQLLSAGVYRGDYSVHGIELLQVFYEDGMIYVKKLTGDNNVPGDKISMRCPHVNKLDATKPVYIDITRKGSVNIELTPDLYPKKFIATYPGEGQIAYPGYHKATFCDGTMHVADESTFVFIWDRLAFCSLFLRCEDLSSECEFV